MNTIQLILLGLGVLIVSGAYGQTAVDFIRSRLKKPETVNNLPDTPVIKSEILTINRTTDFAEIVVQWEELTNMLIAAGMKDSAKELKGILVHMAQEYRTEATVQKVEKENNGIQSLISS